MMELDFVPGDCISHILSFTSPKDVCKCSTISSVFEEAATSNTVWVLFLPSDYQDILLRSVYPLLFSSMKELYFKLSTPFLIDGGKMSFSLERSTGKRCCMLSARELSITWGNLPLYWVWKYASESRFSEVVELRTICWLEIHGKINTEILSRNTNYAAYLILRIEDRAYGLDILPSEVSVETGDRLHRGNAFLRRPSGRYKPSQLQISAHCLEVMKCSSWHGEERVPCRRDDGWMELELGEFFNDGGVGEVKMSLREVKGHHLKGGLVIEGIEIRPKE